VPDFSTLCRRQKALAVQLPYRCSGGPLHLLVDSTGIKVRGEGEWHTRKHGGACRRVWRKVHLAMDEATLEVRAVEITGGGVGDAPVLPDLLGQISARSQQASQSPLSQPTAPTTPAAAAMPLRTGAPTRSSLPGATPSRGRRTALGQQAGTRRYGPLAGC
jgi:hypothetical protein